jgi:hypothetical protein
LPSVAVLVPDFKIFESWLSQKLHTICAPIGDKRITEENFRLSPDSCVRACCPIPLWHAVSLDEELGIINADGVVMVRERSLVPEVKEILAFRPEWRPKALRATVSIQYTSIQSAGNHPWSTAMRLFDHQPRGCSQPDIECSQGYSVHPGIRQKLYFSEF